MALKVAEVLIRWRQEGQQQIQSSNKTLGQSFTDLGNKAKAAGAVLSVGLTAPLLLIGKQAIDAASDLNEATSAVTTVFGKASDEVIRFTRTAASQLGQSQQAALGAASALGALFKGVGLNETQMAAFSKQTLQASADLASFFNVDPGDALQSIKGGLVGESEGLRRFGILLNEATVTAKGLELGLGDVNGELSEGAKVQARYALIMEQLGSAQGDFARTSGGLANQSRILSARLQDIRAEIGTYLLPYALKATTVAGDLMDRFSGLSDRAKGFAVAIGTAAAATGPALIVLGQVLSVAGKLGPAIALITGPFGLVVAGIAALALAFKTDFLGIRTFLTPIIEKIGDVIGRMTQFFSAAKERGLDPFRLALRTLIVSIGEQFGDKNPVVDFLKGVLRNGEKLAGFLTQQLKPAFEKDGLGGALEVLASTLPGLGDRIGATLDTVKTFGATLLSNIITSLKTINWSLVGDTIKSGLGAAKDWLGGVLDGLLTFGAEVLQNILNGLRQVNWALVAQAVKDGLGQFADWVGDRLGEALTFGGALIQNMVQGFQGINWSLVGTKVQEGLQAALGVLKELGTWIFDRLKEVDWAALGLSAFNLVSVVGGAMLTGMRNELLALKDLGTWVWDRLQEVNWETVKTTLFDVGKSLIVGAGEKTGGMLGGIFTGATTMVTWFLNLPANIIKAIGDLKTTLYNSGLDLIQGFWDGAKAKWAEFTAWLGSLKPTLPSVGGGETAPLPSDQRRPGKDQNIPEGQAYGGTPRRKYTWVGEYGPELLINRSLVMPHGAAQSRVAAMGGMRYGGTGEMAAWDDWLRSQSNATRQSIRAMRSAGTLNASERMRLMGGFGGTRADDGTRVNDSFYDMTREQERYIRQTGRENRIRARAMANHAAQSDALNRAGSYGDRTGDYSRSERVLAREARTGAIHERGLSAYEKQYLINNYGSITVVAKDANIARQISDQLSSRSR